MRRYKRWLTSGLLLTTVGIVAGCGIQNVSSQANKNHSNTGAISTSNNTSSDLKGKQSGADISSNGTSNASAHQKLSAPRQYYIEGTVGGTILKHEKLVHIDIDVKKSANLDSSTEKTPFRTIDNVLSVPIRIDSPMPIKPKIFQKVTAEVTVQMPVDSSIPLSTGSVIKGSLNNFYFDTNGVFKNINGKKFNEKSVKWQRVFIKVN